MSLDLYKREANALVFLFDTHLKTSMSVHNFATKMEHFEDDF